MTLALRRGSCPQGSSRSRGLPRSANLCRAQRTRIVAQKLSTGSRSGLVRGAIALPLSSMDIIDTLSRLGGAARFSELGAPHKSLNRLVEAGRIHRRGRGLYYLPGTSRARCLAAELDASISCVTAVREHGLDVPGNSTIVHCSVPSSRGSDRSLPTGVRRHHEDVPRLAGRRLVPLDAAAARAAWCLPYDDAVAMLDEVGRERGIGMLDATFARVRSFSPELAQSLQIDVDTAARSFTESRARLALRRAGLAAQAGVVIPGVGEVDLFVEGLVIAELDGFEYHSGRKEYKADRRRDRTALRLGIPSMRFAYEDSDPAAVLDEVRDQIETMEGKPLAFSSRISHEVREEVVACRAAAVHERFRAFGTPPARRGRIGAERVRSAR